MKYIMLAVALALAGCGTTSPETQLTATKTLAGACNTAASGLRSATIAYKAKKLSTTAERVVDNSAAVIDGFCAPGAKPPTDISAAIRAVEIAGTNVLALNLGN